MSKKRNEIRTYSLAAKYLTYVAIIGEDAYGMEIRYQDENK